MVNCCVPNEPLFDADGELNVFDVHELSLMYTSFARGRRDGSKLSQGDTSLDRTRVLAFVVGLCSSLIDSKHSASFSGQHQEGMHRGAKVEQPHSELEESLSTL